MATSVAWNDEKRSCDIPGAKGGARATCPSTHPSTLSSMLPYWHLSFFTYLPRYLARKVRYSGVE